jgi:CO/xanthine dehydrogenase Mo-binding subunit
LGDRPYIDDMRFPGMIYGAVLLSEHPRALVKRIDTRAAKRFRCGCDSHRQPTFLVSDIRG